ncbi:MAG: hypothetical protein HY438_02560 [DPANN group archaeon]|nr:hypothetical protein [DPANN group archaeon]
MKFRYTWVYALPFLIAAYLLAAYEFSWLLVAGLPFIAAALYIFSRNYDIYIEGGWARDVMPHWLPIGPVTMLCAQWMMGAIVYRLAFNWFRIAHSIFDAGFLAAVLVFCYSLAFLLYKYDGPFVVFSGDVKKANIRNLMILLAWFLASSGIVSILAWMLFGMALPAAIVTSFFVLMMYCFIAT